ncbi:MAG: acyl-CoA synthetase FdrA [Anaerolineae bacterium]
MAKTSRTRVLKNFYRDSVALMQLSGKLTGLSGVDQAYAIMCTPANVDLLRDAGVPAGNIEAGPNDLVLVVEGESEEAVEDALQQADAELRQEAPALADGLREELPPRSIGMAVRRAPEANLALISTPGPYAAAEALKALGDGLHVMIFSDNVSVEDEVAVKRLAHERGLLVMGPDCGTAIVNGIPLGFANVVRRGSIGVIGASGTGLQQVTSLIDRWDAGVSQALGTGSHDLSTAVGGISMLDALDALSADPDTHVIVLISKPPAREVSERVLERARQAGKPVVVDFISLEPGSTDTQGLVMASTLDEAAAEAVRLAGGSPPRRGVQDAIAGRMPAWAPGQRYLRGLFSGGTFSFESTLILQRALGAVYSNTPVGDEYRLADPWKSQGHTTVDLGDDEFTRGRPHPMIDYRLRVERILKEAEDPEVAVILLDVVLGHGSHMDPASELVPAVEKAQKVAREGGRDLLFIASVCGTESDPQSLSRQEQALREAGLILAPSNAEAARLAVRAIEAIGEAVAS